MSYASGQAGGSYTAFFASYDDAKRAARALEDAGVSDVDVQSSQTHGGGFMDSLKRFFSGETYDDTYHSGALVTFSGSRETALPIVSQYGGRIDSTGGVGQSTGGYATTPTGSAGYATTGTDDRTMKLREERLDVDKRPVEQGEVRLRKDVVTEKQNIDVPVTHEEVYVSRRPVAEGEYHDAAGDIGDEKEISVPVMREEVSVQKRAVVTEEVGLDKRKVEETQRVGDTVRKETARVDTSGTTSDVVTDDKRT
ncbi:MAG: YsnF/AvaK domain-containing protein [Candidatus Eremiobacteraeota bacterium]|nr:YsnF/AvaK domain-containing protein [Candidatus Eremiobacteraeota bacterium]